MGGQDCCAPSGGNFQCGAINSDRARSGLRMLRDDQRPFYQLAVEQWSARVGLPAKHPVFFYWVEDPVASVDLLVDQTDNLFSMNVVLFLFGNTCFSLLILWALVEAGFP